MKKIILFSLIAMVSIGTSLAQESSNYSIECWNSKRIFDELIGNTDLIFEGRVLSDSAYIQTPPDMVFTRIRVLVLKQFKGTFYSDTIQVIYNGGHMLSKGTPEGMYEAYAQKGNEAVFFVTNGSRMKLGITDSNIFYISDGKGCGYVPICDKKDVVKEVYEPIEKATGTPRIVLKKNSCGK